jgi:nucleotide-binding universal stress UspA family protein
MLLLVPTAGSVPAQSNAEYIVKIAKSLSASLLVIHIVEKGPTEDGKRALDIFQKEGRVQNVDVQTEMVVGDVVQKILEFSDKKEADLIVMGASQGIVVYKWLATNVLDRSKVPVVIIPGGLDEIKVE